MTTFRRVGHWRTNQYGNTFWVGPHSVRRDDWDIFYRQSASAPLRVVAGTIVKSHEYDDGNRACFLDPNARCPVCGAAVFYYQNEFGSRVFFNDVGPPWPKHGCTDHSDARKLGVDECPEFVRRIACDGELQEVSNLPVRPVVEEREARSCWTPSWVKRSTQRDEILHVTAFIANDQRQPAVRFTVALRSDFPEAGEIVFVQGSRLSFFSFIEFAPVECEIEYKFKPVRPGKRKGATRRKQKKSG